MKTINSSIHQGNRLRRAVALGLGLTLIAAPPMLAQANEDEWYDPTDWFDGNNIETDDTYDYEAYDYDYDYGYDDVYDYGDDWDAYDTWGYDYWDSDYYDADYWDDYDWYDGYDMVDVEPVRSYTYVVFTPADEQSQSDQTSGANPQNRAGQQNRPENQEQAEVTRLSGTIEGVRNLNLERSSGATGTYTIAKVSLENGKSTVVNLGRESQLQDINLQKGDKIEAIGRRGEVGGETVFVAQKLKAQNQTIEANPAIRLVQSDSSMSQRSGQQSKSSPQRQNQRSEQNRNAQLETFQGTVASIDKTTISAGTKDHTYVNLRLESGESALIDFGPSADLEKIDLEEGDTVTVRGYSEPSGGREILLPSLLKIDGERQESITS